MLKQLIAAGAALVTTAGPAPAPSFNQYSVHKVCNSNLDVPYGYVHVWHGQTEYYWGAMCSGDYPEPGHPLDDSAHMQYGGALNPIKPRTELLVESWCPNPRAKAYTSVVVRVSNSKNWYGPVVARAHSHGWQRFWTTTIKLYGAAGKWRLVFLRHTPLPVQNGPFCHDHAAFVYMTTTQDPK